MIMRRIALILRAGRPHYRTSLESLMQSVERYHDRADYIFRLYLAYDVGGRPSADELRFLTNAIGQSTANFEGVTCLTDQDRLQVVDWVRQTLSVPEDVLEVIFDRAPYSFQLNCALVVAMQDTMDAAFLFDDDGYFWIPVDDINETRQWIQVDPIGDHLAILDAGATISVGEIAGARSPIPEALDRVLPADVLARLGTFFEGASEVLGQNSFLSSGYRPSRDGSSTTTSAYSWHCEWVTPANMAISLVSRFPVFFNPPGARGEDAFFALAIQEDDTIRRASSAIFHDPFNLFPDIALGSFPISLSMPAVTPEMLLRFRSALFGWVAYMPLFLKLTRPSHGDMFRLDCETKRLLLQSLALELASHLVDPVYEELVLCFDSYCERADADQVDWNRANHYWRNMILPAVLERPPMLDKAQGASTLEAIVMLERRDDE